MSPQDWRPSITQDAIAQRAALYSRIRDFFKQRGVLEVDTPLLSAAANTDPHLDSFAIKQNDFYLHTSPEHAMKRMLAAGSGSIYQIAKAFRAGERGRRHNPEFTLLEWYRPGFDAEALMTEVATLVSSVLHCDSIERISYRDLFLQHLSLDPHDVPIHQLAALAEKHTDFRGSLADRDTLLDLLMSHLIEPNLGRNQLSFVFHYPASQCALARVIRDDQGVEVAERFELYVQGLELANGYRELSCAEEQLRRFEVDNDQRSAGGKPPMPVDQRLVAALDAGLPDCSGVALGLDRLLMLIMGAEHIDEVVAFPIDRA